MSDSDKYLYSGFIRLHVLHHAAERPIYGSWMIEELPALAAEIDAPNSCTKGRCSACMAWLRNGDVSMVSTRALSKRNIERGYVLACQSRPASSTSIWLDFDF